MEQLSCLYVRVNKTAFKSSLIQGSILFKPGLSIYSSILFDEHVGVGSHALAISRAAWITPSHLFFSPHRTVIKVLLLMSCHHHQKQVVHDPVLAQSAAAREPTPTLF